jgi:DNA topoisomerase-3
MGKALIITEKPSVAQDIAKALGKFKKNKEYFENDAYLLSWAVGHLFELAVPQSMKADDKWALDELPIMPPHFDLKIQQKAADRVKALVRLLQQPQVTEVINACDAGREGELIFRYLVQFANCQKPIKRLWLSSMTPEAIREGFQRLRSDEEMQPLAAAARCRNEADWLIGINATRAFTLRLSGGRGSTVTSLGRVQTPTLALLVEREEKIQSFKPREVFEVFGVFKAAAGTYSARWFDEFFKKEESEAERTMRLLARLSLHLPDAEQKLGEEHGSLWAEHRAAPKLWHREIAQALQSKCAGKQGVVELEEKKPTTQIAPPLYDLTTLQREANNRFGLPARRTLQIAQALYQKHKVITYPRTDSRCLPEDYAATVKNILKTMEGTPLAPFARKILDEDWVRPNKRIFNNAKVSDHFAIIPTTTTPAHLSADEQTIYSMIAKRFVAAFFPPAQFEVTTRITRVEGEPFQTEGKILRALGWMQVYGRDPHDSDSTLPPVAPGERVSTESIEIKRDETRPPARYTEATILSAMENAGKLLDDEELAEAMKDRGLGTPTTRAQIIETLIHSHYLHRHGKELQPTSKALQTIGLLKSIPVTELVSPETTGEWEFRLREIEHSKLTAETFMRDIRRLTREIVEKAKRFTPDDHVADPQPFGQCPKCGGRLQERFKSYKCTNKSCDFSVWKTIAGHLLSRQELETLLRDRKLGPLTGLRSKAGKRFSAIVKLNDQFKTQFDFEATTEAAKTEIHCDKCGRPMAIKTGRRGEFLACTGYPDCKNALSFERDPAGRIVPLQRKELPPELANIKETCDQCGQPMAVKRGRFGYFIACTAYPKCKRVKKIPKPAAGNGEGQAATKTTAAKSAAAESSTAAQPLAIATAEKCDQCGSPMVTRRGRFGPFLACSAYPNCKNIKKDRGEKTPATATETNDHGKPAPRKRSVKSSTAPATAKSAAAVGEMNPPKSLAEATGETCPQCQSPMVIREGRYGKFLACSAYPKCKTTRSLKNA